MTKKQSKRTLNKISINPNGHLKGKRMYWYPMISSLKRMMAAGSISKELQDYHRGP